MNIISAKQFDQDFIKKIVKLTNSIKKEPEAYSFPDKILTTLFFEPSTRTRLSFEAAMLKLGGKILSVEDGEETSSTKKGESLQDSIKTIENYSDIIVSRHSEPNIFDNIESKIPLINAGDGTNEHPTQNLIDIYTILMKYNYSINNKNILFLGDVLYSRTVHGLAYLLNKFYNCKITYCVQPEQASSVNSRVSESGVTNFNFIYDNDVGTHLANADVLYMTRLQSERSINPKKFKFSLKSDFLEAMKEKSMIMHPFPRGTELPTEIDKDHRAYYFEQIKNGLFVRMALILDSLNV